MKSKSYEIYKKLLLKLHDMNVHGIDQTPEADVLRDAMEKPWYALNDQEQDRLGNLSGDLHMLTGDEIKEQSTEAVTPHEINQTWMTSDWDRALKLLRRSTCANVPEHFVAILRAEFWKKLGDSDVSLLFAEYAAKLKPDDLPIRALVLLRRLDLQIPVDSNEISTLATKLGFRVRTQEKQIELLRQFDQRIETHLQSTQFWEPLLQPA